MGDQIDVVDHILQLLKHGRRSSTYKHAVLIGLMDLCLEQTDDIGWPPSMITTRQLAEKVVELYWPQIRPWEHDRLQQNRGRRAAVLRLIEELRSAATVTVGVGAGAARVKMALPEQYERVVREVEWTLIIMPLPKLQRIDGHDTGWLYRIGWDDAHAPKRGEVTAYQEGRSATFDNRINLLPDVAMAFVRMHGLLRPFVEQQWAADVAKLNRLEESRLRDFLFGATRESLDAVRTPLIDLQNGVCFYCAGDLRGKGCQIDHFIPWSRHPDNGLHNLVAAHQGCNNAKSDFLAGIEHLRRWRERNQSHESSLSQVSTELRWHLGDARTLGAARALYWRLPATARLWVQAGEFEIVDSSGIQRVLA